MKKIYEDEIQVVHEYKGATATSRKICPHGNNVWDNGWKIELCDQCVEKRKIMESEPWGF